MSKPEPYKGDDAVKLKCLRDYTIEGGSGAGAVDVEFKAGNVYPMSPRSAAHMLRKTYRQFAEPKGKQVRGTYLGDAPFFVDEKAVKEMADAEADDEADDQGAEKSADAKADAKGGTKAAAKK